MINDPHPAIQDQFKQDLITETMSKRFVIDDIFLSLPPLLQTPIMLFSSEEEKKVSLFTMLIISAILFPNARINYRNKNNYLIMMLFVIGPPSSGKGALSILKGVMRKINEQLRSEYDNECKQYRQQFKAYQTAIENGILVDEPSKPKLKMVDTPGNTTSSKLIEQLADNGKISTIILEPEIDAFGLVSKSTHGNMNTTIMRNAFHQEPISLRRKTNDEYINVMIPKLGFALSGTFNQLKNMISSNEDGTYSRFLIVNLKGSLIWSDVKPNIGHQTIDTKIDAMAEVYLDIFNNWRNKEVEVRFLDHHWTATNDFGRTNLDDSHYLGEHASSLVKRHGLMLMRIAATLTMLRNHDKTEEPILYCNDADFDIASSLTCFSLENSFELFQKLPGEKQLNSTNESTFFQNLPNQFNFATALECAKSLTPQPARRTIERWLHRCKKSGKLNKVQIDCYEKAHMAEAAVAVDLPYNAPPIRSLCTQDLAAATATSATVKISLN
jgi:hypothetical protein